VYPLPFVDLAHLTSRFLIAFFSDEALNPPCTIAFSAPASTHIRRWYRCGNLANPNIARCPLLFVYDERQDQATRRARQACAECQRLAANSNPNRSHTHQRYHDDLRCRSTVVIALFELIISSHDNSTLITIRSVEVCRSPEVWGRSGGRHYATRCNEGSVRTTHRESTTDLIHVHCRQSLVRPFACIYSLLPTNELYIVSCFLALLIINGRSDCFLKTRIQIPNNKR
jgi:hypothetical protein